MTRNVSMIGMMIAMVAGLVLGGLVDGWAMGQAAGDRADHNSAARESATVTDVALPGPRVVAQAEREGAELSPEELEELERRERRSERHRQELERHQRELELELERAEMELMYGRFEMMNRLAEVADSSLRSAAFAVLHVPETFGEPEPAITFLEEMAEEAEKPAVKRLVRIKLAQLYRETDQAEQAQEQLRRLMLGVE